MARLEAVKGRLRAVKEWFFARHPNTVQFSATFFGVVLASLLAIVVHRTQVSSATENILRTSYLECTNVRDETISVKDVVREQLVIQIHQDTDYNLWIEILETAGVPEEIEDWRDQVRFLSENQERLRELGSLSLATMGVSFPDLMLRALRDPQIYGRMNEEIAEDLMDTIPDALGTHGSYERLRMAAEGLTHASERDAWMLKVIGKAGTSSNLDPNAALAIMTENTRRQLTRFHGEALLDLQDYSMALTKLCQDIELEWKRRRCCLSSERVSNVLEARAEGAEIRLGDEC